MTTAGVGTICKTPRVGASKTRLKGVLDRQACADLAGSFLTDVELAIEALPPAVGHRGHAVYAPEGSEAELARFLPETFGLVCRRDATLGVVLLRAIEELLRRGHDCAVLVNADSPTLPTRLLAQTIAALRAPSARLVLGPATDGGYYLIGLKRPHARVFADISWSTPVVLQETVERATEIHLDVEMLQTWYDVDDPASLAMLLGELGAGRPPAGCAEIEGGPALATRQLLQGFPGPGENVRKALASVTG